MTVKRERGGRARWAKVFFFLSFSSFSFLPPPLSYRFLFLFFQSRNLPLALKREVDARQNQNGCRTFDHFQCYALRCTNLKNNPKRKHFNAVVVVLSFLSYIKMTETLITWYLSKVKQKKRKKEECEIRDNVLVKIVI